MNTCFRTAWLTLLVALSLLNPGLLPVDSNGCSHASEPIPPAKTLVKTDSSNETVSAYAVQVTACSEEENARGVWERLKDKGYTPHICSWEDHSGKLWHSVFLGVYKDSAEAGLVARRYREAEGKAVFIKTLDSRVIEAGEAENSYPGKSVDYRQTEAVVPGKEDSIPGESQAVRNEMLGMAEDEEFGPEFIYNGFIEFESFVNTGTSGSFRERNKKNEIRNRLQMRYGTENLFLFSVSNMYLFQTYLNERANDRYRYAKDQQVSRNLRLSSQEAELSFDELYLNYGGGSFRLRAGNQIYGWGTADAFNPTSYFNPSDMREILFRDDDENKVGVPSLSGMFFLGDYTLEAVFVPVHIPPIMAPEGNFWALAINNSFPLPIVSDEPERLGADINNVGYGARLSTSRGGVDMSVSGYRGPDKDQLFLPDKIILQSTTPVALQVRSQTSIVTMFGFDISAALGDFVVQLEAAYSPDKAGVVEQNVTSLTLPFEIDRAHHISYAAGFNYFIPMDRLIERHTGDAVFTFEWFQSKYLDSGLYPTYFTDIITCKFEDSYFDGHITMEIKGIFETRNGGTIFWPEIGYDFQNGLSIKLAYAGIWGEGATTLDGTSIFHYFKDNDVVMGTVRYEY
ncbi:MAG: SPOR domain-containing protein [Deltaproteobacteria bacterium]|nr:SPOR domain-containing protein [Deltaproteobacteria bacterium]